MIISNMAMILDIQMPRCGEDVLDTELTAILLCDVEAMTDEDSIEDCVFISTLLVIVAFLAVSLIP